MTTNNRIQSVDALRGITIIAMILVNNPGSWNHVYSPLLHAEWHGLTPTDLIFPFFLFIVGISISLAYNNKPLNKKNFKKLLIRSLKLIALGLFINIYTPVFPFIENIQTFRIPGVLQRIGIVFFISSIIFFKFKTKMIIQLIIAFLISYFILLKFIPLPNNINPSLENNLNNWVNYVDFKVLGNHLWKKAFDPEGILSTIPAVTTCLLGILAGKIINKTTEHKKEHLLLSYAVYLLGSGYLWSLWFPINKNIWSSSFVLVTAGWATITLALFYYLYDIQTRNTPKILTYVSKNAIIIYFLSMIVAKTFYLLKVSKTQNLHTWLFDNLFYNILNNPKLASLIYAIVVVIFYLFLGQYLFKKKIFFKV
ncbi:acyltransferase family protein [Tenacibaculum sp. 190524A02b]|uniref:acyltransferase family protein n=1 Tax=Tenacibaculum vairaonense TaxID=3137860 RepID=UPI0031FAC883